MVWLSRACRVFCLQKLSLLLNFLFFVYLLSLYRGGVVVEDDQGDVTVWDTGEGEGGGAVAANTGRHDQQPPIIYVITPTFHRSSRKADFTRLAQSIKQVPNIHWIVIEDGKEPCTSVHNVLRRLVANYTYLYAPTPYFTHLGMEKTFNKGIFQRNVGLEWIRWKHKDITPGHYPSGVIYFADDDNTYDLRLFELMRSVKLAGVWPVALVGGIKLEKPRVNVTTGHLITFEVGFAPNRTFAIDMAGFALGLGLVLSKRKGHFPLDTVRGWNEPALFDSLDLSYEDLQVLGLDVRTPQGLLEPLVWHTKTADVYLGEEARFGRLYGYKPSDGGWEV